MSREAQLESTTLRLRAGEQRALWVAARSRCVALRGELRLTDAPRWVGERVLGAMLWLHEGDAHAVDEAGWIGLEALTDGAVVVVCESTPSIAARLAAAWRMMRPGRVTAATA